MLAVHQQFINVHVQELCITYLHIFASWKRLEVNVTFCVKKLMAVNVNLHSGSSVFSEFKRQPIYC